MNCGSAFLGPIPPVGKDAPDRAHGLEQHVGGLGPDHDFHGLVEDHHPRHTDRPTGALDVEHHAGLALRKVRLEHLLVFGRQRRLLAEAARLGRIPHAHRAAALPQPLPVGVLLGVLGLGADSRQAQRRREDGRADPSSVKHANSPHEPATPDAPHGLLREASLQRFRTILNRLRGRIRRADSLSNGDRDRIRGICRGEAQGYQRAETDPRIPPKTQQLAKASAAQREHLSTPTWGEISREFVTTRSSPPTSKVSRREQATNPPTPPPGTLNIPPERCRTDA